MVFKESPVSEIPVTTSLLWSPGASSGKTVPRELALEDVERQETWLGSEPEDGELRLWFKASWKAYHDHELHAPDPSLYINLLRVCFCLLHAIRRRVEERVAWVRVREGWISAGRLGVQIGNDQKVGGQLWTPVIWEDQEDPDWFKRAGLEEISDKEARETK
jgi:hypothetical protein